MTSTLGTFDWISTVHSCLGIPWLSCSCGGHMPLQHVTIMGPQGDEAKSSHCCSAARKAGVKNLNNLEGVQVTNARGGEKTSRVFWVQQKKLNHKTETKDNQIVFHLSASCWVNSRLLHMQESKQTQNAGRDTYGTMHGGQGDREGKKGIHSGLMHLHRCTTQWKTNRALNMPSQLCASWRNITYNSGKTSRGGVPNLDLWVRI